MTLLHHVQIVDAADGDECAAAHLLTDLLSHDPGVQLDTVSEVRLCHDAKFWRLAFEFDVTGTWAGRLAPGFGPDDVGSPLARHVIDDLLEDDSDIASVSTAQEEALSECALSRSSHVRARAARMLGSRHHYGAHVVDALSHALSDPVDEVRAAAAGALAELGDETSVRDMVERLKASDFRTRSQARLELTRMGDRALPALEPMFRQGDEQERWEAAKTISGIDSERAATMLVAGLMDQSPGVRGVAADGLSAMGSNAARPALELLVTRGDEALARIGAHHVLWRLERQGVLQRTLHPVLDALCAASASTSAPVEAERALESISRVGSGLEAVT